MSMRRLIFLSAVLLVLFIQPTDAQYRRRAPQRPSGAPKRSGADYYKILGVPRSADDKAIKKAFRKLSIEWHPDKNPDRKEEAEEKFKQIAAAYTVLSDPEQRKAYDMGGEDAIKGGAGAGGAGAGFGPGGIDPREIFKQFFGEGGSPFGDMGGGAGNVKFSFGGGPGGNPFGGGGMGGMGGMGGEPQQPEGPQPPAASQLHTIALNKPQSGGMGFKVDGSNTITAITPGGVADKAGLRVGDVVWKVDGAGLPPGTRLAAALDGRRHTLGVAYMKGEEGQAFELALPKPGSGGLGIKVDPSNVISRIQSGGAASMDGRLRIGDKILSVNSRSLRGGAKLSEVLKQVLAETPEGGTLRFRVLPTPVAPAAPGQAQGQQRGRGRGRPGGGMGGGNPFGGMGGGGQGGMGGMGIDPEMLRNMMGGMGGGGMPGMGSMGGGSGRRRAGSGGGFGFPFG